MKDFISKLTFKKANIITITISLMLSALAVLFVFWEYPPAVLTTRLGWSIILTASLVLFIHIVSYTLIGLGMFDLPEKKSKETAIKDFNLTKDKYTEVHYDCTTATKSTLSFLLIAHAEYYFYAKLTENEELNLLVENSKQDVIYDSTIRFIYFNAHFKKNN